MNNQDKIKILIVEDNELFRTSLIIALEREAEFEIIGNCANGKKCLEFVEQQKPDLVLIDIDMPIVSGLEACKSIKSSGADIKVLIFSIYSDEESVLEALRAKADAYCTKDTSFEKLIQVIHDVAAGAVWLDPVVASYMHSFVKHTEKVNAGEANNFNLSKRELEILTLLAEGKSNKEIAVSLFITVNTAKAHVCNIMQKLSAKCRTDAAVKASKQGLI